jgi:acetyl esterase/lipase
MKWSVLTAFATLVAAGIPALAEDLPYTRQENVVFAEVHGTGLLADIFRPNGTANGLGIIDVVSGAWYSDRGKLRDHERAKVYDIFCGKGYTVFAIRPGSVSRYPGDELLQNVKTGIRWVKSVVGDYDIDANRLGLMGASAGGHLATLASVTAEDGKLDATGLARFDTHVKATAVFFPPTDFLDWNGQKADWSGRLGNLLYLGGVGDRSPEEIEAKAKALSPRHQIGPEDNLPPFLVFHGDSDPMVPLQQSQVFVDAVKAAGGSAELVVKPGGAHPWPTLHEEVAAMAEWFDKNL